MKQNRQHTFEVSSLRADVRPSDVGDGFLAQLSELAAQSTPSAGTVPSRTRSRGVKLAGVIAALTVATAGAAFANQQINNESTPPVNSSVVEPGEPKPAETPGIEGGNPTNGPAATDSGDTSKNSDKDKSDSDTNTGQSDDNSGSADDSQDDPSDDSVESDSADDSQDDQSDESDESDSAEDSVESDSAEDPDDDDD
ncbi:MAG TPA: hypothetical protein VFC57_00035 [Aeromicrobium sp.]|nr:hypothetical protein [Aeromicrobium sp.]